MKGVVVLQPGHAISWREENWIIEEVDRHGRVLARRASDGFRDFISIAEARRPLPATAGVGDEQGEAAEADDLAKDGPEGERSAGTGRWRRQLAARAIRVVPSKHHQSESQRAADARAIQHFQDCCAVLQLPKRTPERTEAIGQLAAKHGYSIATAYRNLAIVEEAGTADALQRAKRSDSGRIRLNDRQWEITKANLDRYRFVPEYQSIESVLVHVNGDLRAAGLKPISLRTLHNIERRSKTRQEKLLALGRKEQARNEFGSRVGKLPDADFPLAVVQVDHTTVQIIFVDEEQRKPLTDAWLSLVIDCYSRMVLGYYLSFDEPSAMHIGIALARSFLPKDDHLKRMGVTGSWPCWGYPTVILADNAADLNGHLMESASRHIRFDIRNRPVDAPKFGGHIESAFRTFMGQQRSVRGTKFSNPTERGEYDSKAQASMTLSEFEELFTEFLVNDYHLKEHDGDGMKRRCPLQRWEAGIYDGDVLPPRGLPDMPEDPEAVFISMLPIEKRVVQNLSVEIFNERYYSKELGKLSHRADRSRPLEERRHEIRYDPRNIAVIWVRNPETGKYIRAEVQNVQWAFRSLWESEQIRARWERPATAYEETRYQSKKRQEELKLASVGKTQEAKKARRKAEQGKRNLREAVVGPRKAVQPSTASGNPLLRRPTPPSVGSDQRGSPPKIRLPKLEPDDDR